MTQITELVDLKKTIINRSSYVQGGRKKPQEHIKVTEDIKKKALNI
jgi:hypothetical protein